jgi:hypothetical protein
MKNKTLLSTLCSMLLLVFVLNASAQDKSAASNGLVPPNVYKNSPVFVTPASPNNYAGRAFGYNAYGTPVPVGPFKFFLNNPAAPVSLSTDASSNFVAGGSFDASGNWWGVRYGNQQLVKIDTSTGVITTIGTVTGATSITGLAYDFSTGTMYAMDYGASSKLGTLNLTTYVFTPLAGSITGIMIDIACSNTGQIYGVNISDDSFYSIDKTTGNGTIVGALGVNANYAQGMSWDHSVDSCYWAAYTTAGDLRKIDHATGANTVIGSTNMEVDALAIPGAPGPMISHTPLPNTQNTAGPFVVNASITVSGSTIAGAKVFWSRNNTTLTDSVTMTNSGSNYTGNIPGNSTDALYRYRIKAIDALGRVAYAPATGVYSFYAQSTDTSHSTITVTPIINCPKVNWPTSVSAAATNMYGIDSLWVKWYKNNTSTGWKRFNLAHGSGNNWSGTFNSLNSEVAVGDSISYRVFARNSSTQHRVDSTALYTFKIINQVTAIIGTGTTSGNFPFTTYWMDGRTNYLYTNAELLNVPNNTTVTQIGFNIITADGAPINEFTIKMQNTTATSISGFTDAGWTTCYSQTYTLPGTGWQLVTLTTPFVLNGTNLLVEVCYNNSSYSAYSPVYTSSTTGDFWGRYNDLSTASGCGYTAWTMTTGPVGKANTTIVMNPPLGIENISTGIPNTYALSQNYPNPFNPVTKINFALPKQGFVTLKVYDMLGRMVSQLVNEVKTAGTYSVDFNASNYASGIYFYKLEVNGFTDVKRMVLVK